MARFDVDWKDRKYLELRAVHFCFYNHFLFVCFFMMKSGMLITESHNFQASVVTAKHCVP